MSGKAKIATLINAAIATGAGAAQTPWSPKATLHLIGNTSAGAGATAVGVEVSNDNVNFIEIDELTLTLGTAVTSDYYVLDGSWGYVRGNVKSISGTDGTVTLYMAVHV